MSSRVDGRLSGDLRNVQIVPDFTKHAEGSALIECGDTHVICTASVDEKVPHFLRGSGRGWVTSEYGMLPRSTGTRMIREISKGRLSGRTQEIQRLIGRALRSVVDLDALGEKTIWIDCDVIQADGGTRTASITGAFVALALALERLRRSGVLEKPALMDYVAAASVGIVGDQALLDLNYEEDASAEVDMNVVMTGSDLFVELQGTAEGTPFSNEHLDELIRLARSGIQTLIQQQKAILKEQFEETGKLLQEDEVAASSGNSE